MPWHDVDPAAEVPGRGSVEELLRTLGTEGVTARPDLELIVHA